MVVKTVIGSALPTLLLLLSLPWTSSSICLLAAITLAMQSLHHVRGLSVHLPPSNSNPIVLSSIATVILINFLDMILLCMHFQVVTVSQQAEEFFFFAAFLAVVATIFSVMAYFYKYVYYGSSREDPNSQPLLDTGEIPLEERKADDNENEDEDDKELLNVEEGEKKETS